MTKIYNPCLPDWALVLTPDGYKKLIDIKNEIFLNGKKDCSDVFKTNDKAQVFEVQLKNGMCLYATNNHKVTTDIGDVEIKDLDISKHKIKINIEAIRNERYDKEYIRGFNCNSKKIYSLEQSLSFQKGYISRLFKFNDYIHNSDIKYLRNIQLSLACFGKYSEINGNVLRIKKDIIEYQDIISINLYSEEAVCHEPHAKAVGLVETV